MYDLLGESMAVDIHIEDMTTGFRIFNPMNPMEDFKIDNQSDLKIMIPDHTTDNITSMLHRELTMDKYAIVSELSYDRRITICYQWYGVNKFVEYMIYLHPDYYVTLRRYEDMRYLVTIYTSSGHFHSREEFKFNNE